MNAEQFEEFSESLEPQELAHADERWLISYADMMTLLFGFFVMLYAMSGRFEVVEKAAQTFAAIQKTTQAQKADAKSESEVPALVERVNQMKVQAGEMSATISTLQKSLDQEKARNAAKSSTAQELPTVTLENLKKQMKEIKSERDSLRSEVAMAKLGGQSEAPQALEQAAQAASASSAEHTGPKTQILSEGWAGSPFSFTLEYRAKDGRWQSLPIERLGKDGMELGETPLEGPEQKFKAQIKRDDGSTTEVTVSHIRSPSGSLANIIRLESTNDKNREQFGYWLHQQRSSP